MPRALLIAMTVSAAVLTAWWLWPVPPERLILRELGTLVKDVAKPGPESPVASAARAKEASERFVERPEIEFDRLPGSVETRADLAAVVFHARAAFDTLAVATYDERVEVGAGGTTAVMRLSARASAERAGDRETDAREFELRWVRTADGWRMAVARAVEAIRPVP